MSRRSRKPNSSLENAASVVRQLGLSHQSVIDLSNMVSFTQKVILQRVRGPVRSRCQTVFHEFIFETKNLQLPVETFLTKFQALVQQAAQESSHNSRQSSAKRRTRPTKVEPKSQGGSRANSQSAQTRTRTARLVSKPIIKTQEHIVQGTLHQLACERSFLPGSREFIAELRPSNTPTPKAPARSQTPLPTKSSNPARRTPSNASYVELKRVREERRRQRKVPRRSSAFTSVRSCGESVWASTDFKGSFADVEALLSIRRAHLEYSECR